ncbi:MAG: quercetin 2,3-dioxygenase [Candidatus Binatota bacterium]|jgi:redox-sensitive bicupin YhaK (pirin superfamily)|nr:quercetin 2,3-dioxygenase [Candidatus Binatota bacterium]
MIQVRRADERGHARHGWLESYHTFSFADYQDPSFMGFRALRVINEDRVQPGQGFGTHSHRDMEIITYVLEGALEHKDSLGTGSIIRPGDVQRMSAGTGVAHSEFNHSRTELVHFLQIWILPEEAGLAPSYEQRSFPEAGRTDRFSLVASRDAREGSVEIHQDVDLHAAILSSGTALEHALRAGRHAWLQVARGRLSANDQLLSAGDGAAISNESAVSLVAREPAEILLFDLA